MKFNKTIIALVFLYFVNLKVSAQNKFAEGYFTSEAIAIATESNILVSLKKYNPSQIEIENASRPKKNSPMNYLMAPFDAVNISMYDKGFESKLYSLDKEGKVKWDITLGYSDKSVPSPLKISNNAIFSGESVKDADKVAIYKFDLNGKVIWRKELDSLNNVNDIFIDENRLTALVSFDVSKKINHNDGTFSENVYPIYFFMQLDIMTGNIIKKEYQKMGNYLSSLKFSNPFLNSDYSYYLNNSDSAAFLNITKQENATIVTQDMSKDHSIIKLIASEKSYHLLTLLNSNKNRKTFSLISDFYAKDKKYESEIPVEYNKSFRSYIHNKEDSIWTLISTQKNIFITHTDINGKSALYKKINDVIFPVISFTINSNKIFVLQIEGRNTPGGIGKIRIDTY